MPDLRRQYSQECLVVQESGAEAGAISARKVADLGWSKDANAAKRVGRHVIANPLRSISSKETMNLLSLMRLGVDVGSFPGVDRSLVDELFILTQPAHLQKQHSEKLSAEERDLLRADMVRERLKHVSRPKPSPEPSSGGLDKPEK